MVYAPSSGNPVLILSWRTRSHMPPRRWKIPRAATETQRSHINKNYFKKEDVGVTVSAESHTNSVSCFLQALIFSCSFCIWHQNQASVTRAGMASPSSFQSCATSRWGQWQRQDERVGGKVHCCFPLLLDRILRACSLPPQTCWYSWRPTAPATVVKCVGPRVIPPDSNLALPPASRVTSAGWPD